MNTHRHSSTNRDRDMTLQNKRWTVPSDDGAVSKILPKADNTNDTDDTVSRDAALEDPGFIHIADNDDDHFAEITTRRSIYDKLIMSGGGSGRIRDRCSGGKLLIFVGGPWPPLQAYLTSSYYGRKKDQTQLPSWHVNAFDDSHFPRFNPNEPTELAFNPSLGFPRIYKPKYGTHRNSRRGLSMRSASGRDDDNPTPKLLIDEKVQSFDLLGKAGDNGHES
ncbi:hypothetical protein NXS19_004314 [Fusarium pseudograminearum]|nr:hypothetical protein NXS19_004314 [Fusarium pseudograminearum]